MPGEPGDYDSSNGCCPHSPAPTYNSTVISGWLADQLTSPCPPVPSRQRVRSPTPSTSNPKRRQPLKPTHANMNRRSSRRRNKADLRSQVEEPLSSSKDHDSLDRDRVDDHATEEDNTPTPTPKQKGRGRRHAIEEDNMPTPKQTKGACRRKSNQRPVDTAASPQRDHQDNQPSVSLYTRGLGQHPVLHSSNTNSSISSMSSAGKKSQRGTSPAKSYKNLTFLSKPVEYGLLNMKPIELPEDIRELIKDLKVLCENVGIIPKEIEDMFPDAEDRPLWKHVTGRDHMDLMIELDGMQRVYASADSLSTTGDYEIQWYCSVQWPLLDAAFRHQSHAEPKQISQALPIKEFLPMTGKLYSESRLVDFAVNLIPQSVSKDSISNWLGSQPEHLRTVNQSLYAPLSWHPTMITIAVKVGGSETEARVQIAIWLSAWHKRIAQLGGEPGRTIISVPVIIVMTHFWTLYFAIDRGSKIDILQFTESIGDTLSLVKIYRILAVLRRLGEWGLKTFEPWFKATYFGS